MNVIFNEHLHIPYQLTEFVDEFQQADIKISYAPQPVENEVFIWQHPLLKDSEIKKQTIEFDTFEGETVFFQSSSNNSLLPFDIFALSFYLLSRYEEYLPYQKDKHGRFPATESMAYQKGFLQKPLVDILVLKFAKKLQAVFPGLKCNLSSTEYLATYDIDSAYSHKHKGLVRNLGGLSKRLIHFKWKESIEKIIVLLGLKKDPFDTYEFIQNIQEKYHLKTYYFILFADKGKYDKGLNPQNKHFQDLIKQLDKEGNVGIHPSFASHSDKKKLQKEITGLSVVLQRKITLCRSHYLLLTLPETYQNFINNGIETDFTLGFADQAGFRASTCKPFNFFDLSSNQETALKLYPLSYMEGTLKDYMKLSEENGLILIKQLMDTVKSVNGTFISLWHNETLGNKKWKKVYEQSLEYFF